MASKRKKRRRSCTGKQRHTTAEEAYRELFRIQRKRYGGLMNVYKCKFCGGYHIGRTGFRRST